MTFLPRISMRALRPVVAIVLIFAQGMAAFGFPVLQTRHIVKACGCVTPCGAETENCCCAKVALTPEPKRARCSKCVDRDDSIPPAEPQVKWVAGFKAKQCRGESGTAGYLAEVPSLPPAAGESGRDFILFLHTLSTTDTSLVSHISAIQDPPPRRS